MVLSKLKSICQELLALLSACNAGSALLSYNSLVLNYSNKGRSGGKMKRALLAIDVQNEYFTGKLPVTYPPGSLDNILTVVKYAREEDIPVVLIQHTW